MAERTYHQAVEHYLSPLRLAIACVTRTILTTSYAHPGPGALVGVRLAAGEPVRMRGPERIHLRVRLRVRVTQDVAPRGLWDAQTAAYEYQLSDQDDREILAYHWHPESQSQVRTPHLHLGPAVEVGRVSLLTAHLPTGMVALQEVIRLAIESCGVVAVRQDWEHVLRG